MSAFESSVLKTEINNWTLNSDEKLMEALQKFSSDIVQRAKGIIDNIDDLTSDAAEADVRLHNTFNEFLMLADSQFIENRVYEDDDDGDEEKEPENIHSQENVDPKANFVDALKFGMEAMKLYFDNEDDGKGEKLEDIYNIRPLPYIIGTQAFMDSRDVGLGDVDDDDEGDQDAANILNAGSDSDKSDDEEEENEQAPQPKRAAVVDYSAASDDDEEDFDAPPRRPPAIPTKPRAKSDDLDSDDEGDSSFNRPAPANRYDEEEDEEDEVEPQQGSVKDTLAAQLAAKMGQAPAAKKAAPPPPEEDEEEDEDLFGDPADDPHSLFGSLPKAKPKKSNDRDSLNDLFGSMEEERTRSDSIDSLFGTSSSTMKKGGVSSKKSFSDLFGNSNDDNLFDEVEDSKMSLPQGTPAQEKAIPAPNPSMPNKRGSVRSMNASALYSEGLFDEDDDTDIFGAPKVQSTTKSAAPEKTKNLSNLFGGDDDIDPFGASKPKTSQPPKSNKPAKSDLFGDDDDDDDSLFGSTKKSAPPATKPATKPIVAASTAKKPAKSDLFGDDDDDDDLFGSKTKPKAATSKAKEPSPLDEPEAEPTRPKSAAMAGAQASAFALAAAAMPRRPPSDDDDDDDDEEVVPKAKPVVAAKAAPVVAAPVKAAKSDLFGDDDDDDDSLFGSTKKSAPPVSTAPKSEVKQEPITLKTDTTPDQSSPPVVIPPPVIATPISSDSPEATTLSTKRPVSTKLASRMSGLDPSKMIMPGTAPPPKFKKSTPVVEDHEANENPTEAPLGKAKRTGVVTEAGEIVNVTMDRATVKKTGKSRKAPSRKKPALDEDSVVPLVSADDIDPMEPIESVPTAAVETSKAKGLFGDDDDLLAPKPAAVPAKVEPVKVASKSGGLFGDEDDSLFGSPVTSKASLPAKPEVSKAGLFGDDDPLPSKPAAAIPPTVKSDPLKSTKGRGGLFGDDADEPLSVTPKAAVSTPPVKSEPVKSVTKASALFGDDDDDGLFGASTKAKPVTSSKPVSTKPAAAPKGGLFGDDDDDGLFGGSSSLTQKSTAKPVAAPLATKPVAKSLFGDDDDDGLFGSSSSSSKPATKAPAAAKASSLFGDDDDDLFSGAKKSTASNPKTRGLFDD